MPSLDLNGRHPGTVAIMRWFEHDHLPPRLKAVAGRAAALAELMVLLLPDDPELVAGLRKLKEAKDCFVCAELSRTGDRVIPPDAPVIREMDGGEALAYLGTDASRWADEFLFRWKVDAHGTPGTLDPGAVLGWFANAIQAGYDAARARYDRHPEPDAAAELIGQAVGHASMCWTPGTGDAVFDSAEASRVVTDLMRSLGFDPPEKRPEVEPLDPRDAPGARAERAAWTRDIAQILRGLTAIPEHLRPGVLYAADWLDGPNGPKEPVEAQDGTERPEDALRRYAGQLERLAEWFRAHPEIPMRAGTDDADSAVTTALDTMDSALRLFAVADRALPRIIREMGLGELRAGPLADAHGGSFGLAPAGSFEAGERTEDAVPVAESGDGPVTLQ